MDIDAIHERKPKGCVRSIEEMPQEITDGETFSAERAMLDFTCSTVTTMRWIVSHERIRRELEAITRQRNALQRQVTALQDEIATMKLNNLETVQ